LKLIHLDDPSYGPAAACHNDLFACLCFSNKPRKMNSGIANGVAHKVKVLGFKSRVNINRGCNCIAFPEWPFRNPQYYERSRKLTQDSHDPYDLERFVEAQSRVMEQVRAELRQGSKRGHWMWFVFPQIRGLGSSPTAVHFAIASREEAVAYLKHPILGPRLVECTRLVLSVKGRTSEQIFGQIDSLKFRSSMTLFAQVTLKETIFEEALQKYFDNEPDPLTLEILE
jgi:uncharacterized protein (DUF1810 family)